MTILTTILASVLSMLTPAGDREPCIPLDELTGDLQETLCKKHPWGRGPTCNFTPTADKCIDITDKLAECRSEITTCEYEQCAADLIAAPCGIRPPSCKKIVSCLNQWYIDHTIGIP